MYKKKLKPKNNNQSFISENNVSDLNDLGFESGRMKTGTPPRVDGRSLDYSQMEEQPGDKNLGQFSFLKKQNKIKQKPCHITYTNKKTHKKLEEGFGKSSTPVYTFHVSFSLSISDKVI